MTTLVRPRNGLGRFAPWGLLVAAGLLVAGVMRRVVELIGWVQRTGIHGGWIASWSAVGVGGTMWAPLVMSKPVLLMALAPRAVFVALAAPHLDLLPFVALGLLRLSVTDASYFLLGRRLPEWVEERRSHPRPGVRGWVTRGADKMAEAICRRPWLAGPFLFLRPSGKYLAVAGAYGVSSRMAGLATVTGTVTYLVFMYEGISKLA